METPTHFSQRVLAAARGLLASQPAGVRHADLAAVLGSEFLPGGDQERRLRRVLATMRAAGVLAPGGHGLFVAGREIGDADALGPGVAMADAVERFFADQGGLARMGELRRGLKVRGEAGRRALSRALEAGRYGNTITLQGGDTWWILPEAERLRTVLPGWRLAPDVSLAALAAGGDWRDPNFAEIDRRRRGIGRGVQAARKRAGADVGDLLRGEISKAFAGALERGPGWVLTARGAVSFSEWWRTRVEALGREDALEFAWGYLEAGQRTGEPCTADNLDAPFWRVLGDRLGADPADLSRGRYRSQRG